MDLNYSFHAVLCFKGENISDESGGEDVNSLEHVLEKSSADSWTVESVTEDEGPGGSGASSVLRLRGLPFTAQPEHVRAFFQPTKLLEVYFCRRDGEFAAQGHGHNLSREYFTPHTHPCVRVLLSAGRPTGEAYVVLEHEQLTLAMQLDKKFIGDRYIELFDATAADLRAVKKMLEDRSLQGYVVRLRGLPYSATEADVRAFMDGVQLSPSPDCIVFAHGLNGRPTGEAYVELADEQALTLAMTRHKEVMGTRYIEVFNSSKMDKLQARKQLEGLSSPVLDSRRWASAAAVQDIRGLPRRQQQQQQHLHTVHPQGQALQMPAYHDAAAHPLADRLASCHLSPVMGCSLVPASVGGVSAVTAGLAASMPAHTLQQSSAGVMPTAAYPPPGLQAVQVSQPGLLALPHGVPGTSGLPAGGPAGVSGALSPAALQLGHLLPLPMLQAMMPPTAAEAGPACEYPQQQQVQSGHFLMQGHQPQGGLACTPLRGYGVPQVCNQGNFLHQQQQQQQQQQQLPTLPQGPLPGLSMASMPSLGPHMLLPLGPGWPPASVPPQPASQTSSGLGFPHGLGPY